MISYYTLLTGCLDRCTVSDSQSLIFISASTSCRPTVLVCFKFPSCALITCHRRTPNHRHNTSSNGNINLFGTLAVVSYPLGRPSLASRLGASIRRIR